MKNCLRHIPDNSETGFFFTRLPMMLSACPYSFVSNCLAPFIGCSARVTTNCGAASASRIISCIELTNLNRFGSANLH